MPTHRQDPAPASRPPHSPAATPATDDDRLYLVTRTDLSVGYQIAQTAHVVADWQTQHPDDARRWQQTSGTIVCLTVPDEDTLRTLEDTAERAGLSATRFIEPDIGDELTALAFTPDAAARKLLANLPLAGRRIPDQAPLLARERALRSHPRRTDPLEDATIPAGAPR